jgi:hypothetical protein
MAVEAAPPLPDIIDLRKRRREMRALWRLCGWGGAAAVLLSAVAIVTQTRPGAERLQLTFAHISEPVRSVASVEAPPPVVERVVARAVENEAKTRRLAAEVEALTADRERLATRIASLEQQLGNVTGSIKAQAASPTNPPPAKLPEGKLPRLAPLAMPDIADTAAPWSDPPPAQAAATVEVPMPPTRVATIPIVKPELAPEPTSKMEYGIDLGSGLNLDQLRQRWLAVKANYGPLLSGLHPIAMQDQRARHAPLRLVAGPLPTVADAVHLCARFATARAACRPTKFNGENLAQP